MQQAGACSLAGCYARAESERVGGLDWFGHLGERLLRIIWIYSSSPACSTEPIPWRANSATFDYAGLQMHGTAPIFEERRRGQLERLQVLIPARNPDLRLISLVEELDSYGFHSVLVVDDGSGSESAGIFNYLKTLPRVYLVRRAMNHGKGGALKAGFHFILNNVAQIDGVITADADGQHTVHDIVAVAMSMELDSNQMTLGVREFGRDVPLRNRFGNRLTKLIFRYITRMNISDTQTGLRGLPRSLLPQLVNLPGERYEYEMSVLAYVCRHVGKPREIPVETIYLSGGPSSHFHPLWDSLRIYLVLMRFYLSTLG